MRIVVSMLVLAACGSATPEPSTPGRGSALGSNQGSFDCQPQGRTAPVEVYCYNVTSDPCCGEPGGAAWKCNSADYASWVTAHCPR